MIPIRVLLVDDHPVLLKGLASMLEPADGFAVVGLAQTAREAIELHQREQPDVTVLDLRLGTEDGIEVLRTVRAGQPSARFLVLSTFDSEADVRSAVEAGAVGYLLKTSPPETVIGAIRAIHAGLRVLSPEMIASLDGHSPIWDLTPRERAVLEEAAQGAANKAIATKLTITEATVKGHLVNIFAKLGAESRTQAIAKALAKGLLDLGRRSRRDPD